MLYQQIGKTDWLLPGDIPEYITIDKTNNKVNKMQSYVESFSGCNHDFNVVTIDMLTDVFEEFGDFLFCIYYVKTIHTISMTHIVEIKMVSLIVMALQLD